MLSSISLSSSTDSGSGPGNSSGRIDQHSTPERRRRWTEAVYAFCVLVAGVLLLMTAV